ncbi:MAG TPA: DinB family protein [Gemmatimonadaceae bacterium]|nr:DinB family protein [Gemmatimonadaceae bacterium]
MTNIGQSFLDHSRQFLLRDFLPKIAACANKLSDDDIWWRPNDTSNSIGNLLLHLSGNVRQWIVSGVGGAPDARDRPREFAERTAIPGAELMAALTATVEEAEQVLANISPDALLEIRHIQGNDVTILEAVYHVVEHFSMHTGQITYITKLRTGQDLGFHRHLSPPKTTAGEPPAAPVASEAR